MLVSKHIRTICSSVWVNVRYSKPVICFLVWVFVSLTAVAQNSLSNPLTEIPLNSSFPDGISPTHVYAKVELLNRRLDRLIEVWNEQQLSKTTVKNPQNGSAEDDYGLPLEIEKDLRPMHVYQAMLICASRLQQLDDHDALKVRHIPTISSQPRSYDPRDVFFLVTLMLENVEQIARTLDIEDMPDEEVPDSEKSPTDVFHQGARAFMKLSALNGRSDLRPGEVFSEMVRAVEDARSILSQTDPACRYRIDRPENDVPRVPGDVFEKCLEIRRLIRQHCEARAMEVTPIPDKPLKKINPRDVFFQTQIIIAELNMLKREMGTTSSTPLAINVGDSKTPTDVYQQGLMVEYLVRQIQTGADIQLSASAGPE